MRIDAKKSIKAGRLVENEQFQLASLDQISGDYLILIPIVALAVLPLVAMLSLIRNQAPIVHILIALVLLIALLLYLHYTFQAIKRNNLLIRIETGLDKRANRETSLRLIESVGWKLIENYKSYLAAITSLSDFTWGQEVTIIFDEGCIYVNCRNRIGGIPSARSPWSFGRCEKCLSQFYQELQRLNT